jgi:hypothetical protein
VTPRRARPLYATPRGTRYHRHYACVGLNSWATWNGIERLPPTVTQREAARRGLQPCKVCQPSPLLALVS